MAGAPRPLFTTGTRQKKNKKPLGTEGSKHRVLFAARATRFCWEFGKAALLALTQTAQGDTSPGSPGWAHRQRNPSARLDVPWQVRHLPQDPGRAGELLFLPAKPRAEQALSPGRGSYRAPRALCLLQAGSCPAERFPRRENRSRSSETQPEFPRRGAGLTSCSKPPDLEFARKSSL